MYLQRESQGHCTGTLIHPEIVLFAAHCLRDGTPPPTHALFGERASAPARSVSLTHCVADPEFSPFASVGEGHDVAYCTLAEPVHDVPIVPLASSCTSPTPDTQPDWIAVGFGDDVKRDVPLPLVERVNNEAYLGGDGKGTCYGDSGGPLFARDETGQLRVIAVVSWAPGECGDGEYASLVAPSLPFLESSTHRSLAPCPDCGSPPESPAASIGSWADGCTRPLTTEPGTTCAADDAPIDADSAPEEMKCSVDASAPRSSQMSAWLWLALVAIRRARLRRRRPPALS